MVCSIDIDDQARMTGYWHITCMWLGAEPVHRPDRCNHVLGGPTIQERHQQTTSTMPCISTYSKAATLRFVTFPQNTEFITQALILCLFSNCKCNSKSITRITLIIMCMLGWRAVNQCWWNGSQPASCWWFLGGHLHKWDRDCTVCSYCQICSTWLQICCIWSMDTALLRRDACRDIVRRKRYIPSTEAFIHLCEWDER